MFKYIIYNTSPEQQYAGVVIAEGKHMLTLIPVYDLLLNEPVAPIIDNVAIKHLDYHVIDEVPSFLETFRDDYPEYLV